MTKRKTTEEFKKEIFNLTGDEYKLLTPYVTSKTKVKLLHNRCKRSYWVKPNVFLTGRRCPYCSKETRGINRRLNNKQFLIKVKNQVGGDYTFLEPYVNTRTKLKVRHNKCGTVYYVTPDQFLHNKTRCPYCNPQRPKDKKFFLDYIRDNANDEYEIVGTYTKASKKVKIKHLKCGKSWLISPTIFMTGVRCPYCTNIHGESLIQHILDEEGIKYEYPKGFSDLKDKHMLHYDFYIPGQRTLIEYQGKQHYQPVEHFGGNDSFKKQQFHDNLKRRYAKEHGYNLIEVPYTANNNEDIKLYLAKHGLTFSNKITPNSLHFKRVAPQDLHNLMLNYHYLHRVVRCTFAYAMYYDDNIVGMVTYSKVRKSVHKSISDNATINNTLELSRLYIKDEVSQTVPNITSQFVSWSLRQLKKLGNWYIISFADSGMHHVGAIYQATNFLYCGTTRKGIFCYNGPHKKGGQWKAGVHYRFFIIRSKKYRYVKFVGSKSFKKGARKELKLKVQSYPKADKIHYSIGDTEERFIRDRKTNKIYSESELLRTFPNYNWSKGDEW